MALKRAVVFLWKVSKGTVNGQRRSMKVVGIIESVEKQKHCFISHAATFHGFICHKCRNVSKYRNNWDAVTAYYKTP